MLIDDRSLFMYPRGVFGRRIIESKRKPNYFYDKENMSIYLVLRTDKSSYTFVLVFKSEALFWEIKNDIYPNKDKILVVAGNWQKSGKFDVFKTAFTSKKQLAII
jgi:hypothetical protein